jgi:hypothetical protein
MSEQPDTPKRFIAGAKCPQCHAQDRVVMFRKSGQQYRECVACGYIDEMNFEQNYRELETRVNRTEAEKREAVAVVRLIDPDIAS